MSTAHFYSYNSYPLPVNLISIVEELSGAIVPTAGYIYHCFNNKVPGANASLPLPFFGASFFEGAFLSITFFDLGSKTY